MHGSNFLVLARLDGGGKCKPVHPGVFTGKSCLSFW